MPKGSSKRNTLGNRQLMICSSGACRTLARVLPDVPAAGKPRPAELAPVRKRGLVDEVVQTLEHGIRNGAFQVGSKLPPEPQLQAQLGVGRTTVREAVKVLAHAGMLEVKQGDGTYVRATTTTSRELVERLSRAHTQDVLAVRRGLDLEMARMSTLARTDEDIDRMSELIARLHEILAAPDRSSREFADVDTQLRLAIATSTHNPVLVDLSASFAIAMRRLSEQLAAMPGAMETCTALHECLLHAIRDRDRLSAQEATTQYLDWVASKLEELEPGSAGV
ncbi:FadR family transcriptional regulator [Nocardia abscessus]|uniref:FadR family transcriptional regulator n=2 Tax=Nocardia abscessus TaxID=120957 RepID=A0ABS0CG06_9NOCA|nr:MULTISPECIES: FadR/GntR family transcriptional regulator [Nocardia]MBF6222502.1 FadR family transcriptional regulator [Nocardia abscessus]MBF6228785.1 FadR family transcriptional regulator [Nocardia abscessus]